MTTVCLLCMKPIGSDLSWQAFLRIEKNRALCDSCSNRFVRADIIEEGTVLDRVHSLYAYDEPMRDWLHQYKFLQDVALADVFADELNKALTGRDIIVPIPMHPERVMERTFAHVDTLLDRAKRPYRQLLEKRTLAVMGEKNRQERLAMGPLFRLKPGAVIEPVTYRLVDDIYTTGTTLRQAAQLLKDAGAARVEAVTLIRSVQK
ncbi:ComF family protein [Sporosarcina trichiuri]|uniref:ComF family protein n=1 Tax=Sporosarcina trichiuri TaxID=3056445 RepID=UPI0025B3F912|nr:phosphoribosyltransferase family protein [Sporosarcina sp. 0.2-SM1T-5]WJY26134.1 phosphoribosyltransferase family protein [Sporosarcina sp. 0.2-SM1T-5]